MSHRPFISWHSNYQWLTTSSVCSHITVMCLLGCMEAREVCVCLGTTSLNQHLWQFSIVRRLGKFIVVQEWHMFHHIAQRQKYKNLYGSQCVQYFKIFWVRFSVNVTPKYFVIHVFFFLQMVFRVECSTFGPNCRDMFLEVILNKKN
jgi:hypothetical protein